MGCKNVGGTCAVPFMCKRAEVRLSLRFSNRAPHASVAALLRHGCASLRQCTYKAHNGVFARSGGRIRRCVAHSHSAPVSAYARTFFLHVFLDGVAAVSRK